MKQRIVSGTRPTGPLHWGHYFGVLENWVKLQDDYECFFFVADWHALTSEYENSSIIPEFSKEIIAEWLAAGLDPKKSTIFVQSDVPEHTELNLLLSMFTPLGWLERVPSYKDMKQQLKGKDLNTYGFLGYPLLQTADVLLYKGNKVPVGEDQVPHIEFAREVVRRFTSLSGKKVFPEPKPLLTKALRVPGLDGRKMSKSFKNSISICDSCDVIKKKLSGAITDPARKRRDDPGHPEVCNIFAYQKLYLSSSEVKQIADDCESAKIGCVDCKKNCIETALKFWEPISKKANEYKSDNVFIEKIIKEGAEKARAIASDVIKEAKSAFNIGWNL